MFKRVNRLKGAGINRPKDHVQNSLFYVFGDDSMDHIAKNQKRKRTIEFIFSRYVSFEIIMINITNEILTLLKSIWVCNEPAIMEVSDSVVNVYIHHKMD